MVPDDFGATEAADTDDATEKTDADDVTEVTANVSELDAIPF